MSLFDVIDKDNAAGFYTVAKLTQDCLIKTLLALDPETENNKEMDILWRLREAKRMAIHCKKLMEAADNVTPLQAVRNDHN